MVVSEERFIGRAIERDHITEYSAMLGLEIAQLPVDTFRRDNFLDLIELFAQQHQLELGPLTADAVERLVLGIERRSAILDELSALHVIEKLVVLRIQLAP